MPLVELVKIQVPSDTGRDKGLPFCLSRTGPRLPGSWHTSVETSEHGQYSWSISILEDLLLGLDPLAPS